jgi:hypothetical protein
MKFTKRIEEILSESNESGFQKVLLGGSIGERVIRNKRELKGKDAGDIFEIFSDKSEAKISAKNSNKGFSPGEKNYYGLKYVVAEVINGKFTGK